MISVFLTDVRVNEKGKFSVNAILEDTRFPHTQFITSLEESNLKSLILQITDYFIIKYGIREVKVEANGRDVTLYDALLKWKYRYHVNVKIIPIKTLALSTYEKMIKEL